MSRYQLVIKDGRGKAVQSREMIASYAKVAREMVAIKATFPLSVWQHWSTGTQLYDDARTRKLTAAIVSYGYSQRPA